MFSTESSVSVKSLKNRQMRWDVLSKIPVFGKCFRKSDGYELVHVCELPLKEDILVNYIEAGWFIMMRRRLKNLLLVSATNPRSKAFLKSSEAIREEKARHLQHYYWVVHPFSTGRSKTKSK